MKKALRKLSRKLGGGTRSAPPGGETGGATAAGADAVEGGLAVAARSRKASHEGLDYYQSGAARKGSAALKTPSTRKGSAGHAGGGRADVGDREASASDARDGGGGGGTSSTVLASPQVGLTAWDPGAEPHADELDDALECGAK